MRITEEDIKREKHTNKEESVNNQEEFKGYEDDSLEYSSLSPLKKIKYNNDQFKKRSEGMDSKQKMKYFFQYYKFVMIGCAAFLIIGGIALNLILKAMQPTVLHLVIVNQIYNDDSVNADIMETFRSYNDLNNKNYIAIYKDLSVSANEDPEAVSLQMTSYQTIGYYNMHDMVDVIICDEEALKTYTWSDDTTAIDLSVDEELHSKLEPYVVVLEDKTKIKNNGKPYEGALDITNSEFVKTARIEYSPVYLLIPSSKTVDNEATINFIKMIYNL